MKLEVIMASEKHDKPIEEIALHIGAVILGLLMALVGLGLGVTMVLLPVGIPLGLAGIFVLLWGLTPGWR
jgi:hypothetical protein